MVDRTASNAASAAESHDDEQAPFDCYLSLFIQEHSADVMHMVEVAIIAGRFLELSTTCVSTAIFFMYRFFHAHQSPRCYVYDPRFGREKTVSSSQGKTTAVDTAAAAPTAGSSPSRELTAARRRKRRRVLPTAAPPSCTNPFHYDPLIVVMGALVLATRIEENSRRARDVINSVYRAHFPRKAPLQISESFWVLKDQVAYATQDILRVTGRRLLIQHPQHYVLHIARAVEASRTLSRVAYALCNDSFRLPLCLVYEPHAIACAAIYLAAEFTSERVAARTGEWWIFFDTTRREVEDVAGAMIELYQAKT